MNTDAPWPTLEEAEARVPGIQAKLHRWATDSPDRRFDDLFNLVCDPAFSGCLEAGSRQSRSTIGWRLALSVLDEHFAKAWQVDMATRSPRETGSSR